MDAPIVDAILTAILQWRVSWLDEQKKFAKPPPISRKEPRRLKITYENYKDYESTFMPLLMHEIWAQIFESWSKLETLLATGTTMEVDSSHEPHFGNHKKPSGLQINPRNQNVHSQQLKQLLVGVATYKTEGLYQCTLRCHYIVEARHLASHMKLIGEGDLIRLDLVTCPRVDQPASSETASDVKKDNILSLFAYVQDVSSERINQYTKLADCFIMKASYTRNCHLINYNVIIAKRPLKLKTDEPMRMSGLYYLKPMIRQIESVAMLKESALASDILCPKVITCQLSIPTIVSIKSPHYNDMQYKAIIGTNEALVRNIPKIQLIQGPPGTGKTHTLCGIIKHFYTHWRDSSRIPKILICTPSNGAIDEVARRLYKEREFMKTSITKRSLRLVRVGQPEQVADSVRHISLDDLVETNSNYKVEMIKKKHLARVKQLEDELSKCDTEITNLRYMERHNEIPGVEARMASLFKELEASKSAEELTAKREASEAAKRNMRFELIKNADVILTTLNSCQRHPLDSIFKGEHAQLSFHCVIVDEASQCCEPELLMPLCYRISKMILIGDPMQLPATVISKHAQEFDFGRSLFERFFNHFDRYSPKSPIIMLTEQYRMHPDICHFPSKRFYDDRLISAPCTHVKYPLRHYILFDLRHSSESKSRGTSMENEVEANFVRNLLVAVLTKAPENSRIGVITPYRGQLKLLTSKIMSLKSQKNMEVNINTCDGFQGQEQDIIILSCVRAFEHGGSIGFLKSFQRMNVSLTRAKYSLIVVISVKALSKDDTWKALIEDARNRRCLDVLTQTPSTANLEKMITTYPPKPSMSPTDAKSTSPMPCNQTKTGSKGDVIDLTEDDNEYMTPMDID